MFESNGIVYASSANNLIKIKSAKVTGNMMMLLTFSTGEKRVFDAMVLSGEAFAPLHNPAVFENFKIIHGVVTWANEEIDCAPEYMYENSYEYSEAKLVCC